MLSEGLQLAIVEMAQSNDSGTDVSPKERQRVAAMVLKALKKMGRQDLLPYIWIVWSSRLTSSMGRAVFARPGDTVRKRFQKNTIDGRVVRMELSVPLWSRANEAQRNQTILHELSHLITHQEALLAQQERPAPHGRRWKNTMHRIGADAARTHTVDTGGLGRLKAKAQCRCMDHYVTPRMAGEILMGRRYTCKKCFQRLQVKDISREQEQEYLTKASQHELRKKARRGRR
ncbi:MAG: SprT family zinc-dependent metalloprotease [Planctomycetota bacterium]